MLALDIHLEDYSLHPLQQNGAFYICLILADGCWTLVLEVQGIITLHIEELALAIEQFVVSLKL